MKHYGDIRRMNGAEIARTEVVVGGSPCQDLSVAGKRAGLQGERSGLFMEQIRLIKEMRARDKMAGRTGDDVFPRFCVWENVAGALSSNGGDDFRVVLEELAGVAEDGVHVPKYERGGWSNAGTIIGNGYSLAWRLHDAQYWGTPQRRRRIAVVADFNGCLAPEILFERDSARESRPEVQSVGEGLPGDSEPGGAAGEGAARDIADSTSGTGEPLNVCCYNPWDSQTARVYGENGIWHSLNANENGGQSRDAVFAFSQNGSGDVFVNQKANALTANQNPCGRGTAMICFQGQAGGETSFSVQEEKSPCPGTTQTPCVMGFKLGNSEKARSIGLEKELAPTINAECGGNKAAVLAFAQNQRDEVRNLGEVAGSLAADTGMKQQTYVIQGNCIDRADTAGCNGKGWNDDDICYTLNTVDRPAVFCLDQQGGKGGANYAENVSPAILSDSHGTPHAVYDARGNGNGEVAPTLTGDHQNRVTDYTAILCEEIAGTLDAHYANGPGMRGGVERDFVAAVDCRNGTENPEINGTLQAKSNGGTSVNLQNICRVRSVVRRLTPLECTRLMSFPDGWVDLGEWVDSKGKRHKEADAPKYRALGNSICLPFWYWLMKRIMAHCKEKTMGSLFAGIGGFELCWNAAGGETLWSSEIDEFCNAVRRKHFGDEDKGIDGDWKEYVPGVFQEGGTG